MRTPLLLLAVAAFTSVADAQTVTPLVFVRHGVGATRVEWLSNNDIRVQRALPIQEVFKGDSACFQIEHGNPFLYTYSIATKAEKPQNEEVVTKLASAVAGLSGLTRSASSALAQLAFVQPEMSNKGGRAEGWMPSRAPASALDFNSKYKAWIDEVVSLRDAGKAMDQLRYQSDEYDSMEEFIEAVNGALATARRTHADAEERYGAVKDDPTFKDIGGVILHDLQQTTFKAIQETAKEYRKTAQEFSGRYCTAAGDSLLTVTLAVKPKLKLPEGVEAARTVEGPLASMRIEPKASHLLEMSAGGLVTFFKSKKEFSLKDGVVQVGERENDIGSATGAFTNLRLDRRMPFWISLGAVDGASSTPDIYAGFTLKPSYLSLPRVNLGAGLIIAQVPGGLKNGGQVGHPLPQNFDELDEIVSYKPAFGLGIMITFTGITGLQDRK